MPSHVSGETELCDRLRRVCAERDATSPVAALNTEATVWASDQDPPTSVYRAWVRRSSRRDAREEMRVARAELDRLGLETVVVHAVPYARGALSGHLVVSRSTCVAVSTEREAWMVMLDALDSSGVE
jgi:hypothetical protein